MTQFSVRCHCVAFVAAISATNAGPRRDRLLRNGSYFVGIRLFPDSRFSLYRFHSLLYVKAVRRVLLRNLNDLMQCATI